MKGRGPKGGRAICMTTAWPCKKFYGGAFERPEPQSRMSMPLSVYRRLHFTRFSTTAPERDRLWQQDPLLENLVKCNLRRVSTFYIFRDAREALRRVVTALLQQHTRTPYNFTTHEDTTYYLSMRYGHTRKVVEPCLQPCCVVPWLELLPAGETWKETVSYGTQSKSPISVTWPRTMR